MSQPWDTISTRPRIGNGSFHCLEGRILKVTVSDIGAAGAGISLGRSNYDVCVCRSTAKVLSEFFAALSQQLEE